MHWERILDVNLNRLSESLKIIEDICRFSIEDRVLLGKVRKLRHMYLSFKKRLPYCRLVEFRDSESDFGRKISFDALSHKNIKDIIVSNFSRAKESSRVIEEILRTFYPGSTKGIKEIRFSIYDIEKSAIIHFLKVFDPSIHVLIDPGYVKKYRLKQVLSILIKKGATMIQLRVKMKSDREFLNYARSVRKIIKTKKIPLIINDRLDIAQMCGANGVHLGQCDAPVRAVRSVLGSGAIIGSSVHNIAEAKKAEKEGADYLGVGSVFSTATKADAKVCGLRRLKAICRVVKIPVIGIGGINSGNYKSVLRAGAAGIAVASYLFKEGDLVANLRSLTEKR